MPKMKKIDAPLDPAATDTRARGAAFFVEHLDCGDVFRSVGLPLGAIESMQPGSRAFALTMGRWSLWELIRPFIAKVGGAPRVTLSTWSVGQEESANLGALLRNGEASSVEVFVDESWPLRQQKFCGLLVGAIGAGGVRLLRTHAKILLVEGERGVMFAHGSLNLNPNRRLESCGIEFDTGAARFAALQFDDLRAHVPTGLTVSAERQRAIFDEFARTDGGRPHGDEAAAVAGEAGGDTFDPFDLDGGWDWEDS